MERRKYICESTDNNYIKIVLFIQKIDILFIF